MYVYIIECDCGRYANNPVKIGIAENPESRISQLQTGNPFRLRLVSTVKCDDRKHAERMEKRLHIAFAKFHMHGEWFNGGGVKLSNVTNSKAARDRFKKVGKDSLFGSKMKTQNVKLHKENDKLRSKIKHLEAVIDDPDKQLDLIHLSRIETFN